MKGKRKCITLPIRHRTFSSVLAICLSVSLMTLILVSNHSARVNMAKIGIGHTTRIKLTENFLPSIKQENNYFVGKKNLIAAAQAVS